MITESPLIKLWDDCKAAAVEMDDAIQKTSAAYADAVMGLTDSKVGTLQERLQQYRVWLEEGVATMETLEQVVSVPSSPDSSVVFPRPSSFMRRSVPFPCLALPQVFCNEFSVY